MAVPHSGSGGRNARNKPRLYLAAGLVNCLPAPPPPLPRNQPGSAQPSSLVPLLSLTCGYAIQAPPVPELIGGRRSSPSILGPASGPAG